ncbi:helix-turn-helix transcriptional regulator [Hydrogenophaga sp. T2]|uniref:helix-turn-helix transcriptional regulator n=1 Tax=Hydrogenophaga sp. T2 TaxID=3132823 RepID=UPI003CED04A6
MNPPAVDALTSAIYDAALDPLHWPSVLAQLKVCFRTEAETFYVLDFDTRRLTQAHLAGITPHWMACFDGLYFAPDNPWNVHSEALHRLGMVRTNERLDAYTRERGVLYRSAYYHEWMRPQGFRYSLGNTLTTERSGIANVTLLRAPDLPTFDAREVRLFERLSAHFVRALRIRERLGAAALRRDQLAGALDSLQGGVLIVTPDGTLVHGNRAALQVLARGDALGYRQGRVVPAHPAARAVFAALLQGQAPRPGAPTLSPDTLVLPRTGGGLPLRVQAAGLALPLSSDHAARPCVLLALSGTDHDPPPSRADWLRHAHGLTPAEARLAEALLDGLSLRDAADRLGLTYGSARTRLKGVFVKTGVHRQAELIARLQRELATPLHPH